MYSDADIAVLLARYRAGIHSGVFDGAAIAWAGGGTSAFIATRVCLTAIIVANDMMVPIEANSLSLSFSNAA